MCVFSKVHISRFITYNMFIYKIPVFCKRYILHFCENNIVIVTHNCYSCCSTTLLCSSLQFSLIKSARGVFVCLLKFLRDFGVFQKCFYVCLYVWSRGLLGRALHENRKNMRCQVRPKICPYSCGLKFHRGIHGHYGRSRLKSIFKLTRSTKLQDCMRCNGI